jgi:hypothetical protein
MLFIDACPAKVWDALIKPQLTQQFGSQVITDWQVGSPILYKDTTLDRIYENKGKVLQVEQERYLISTFWDAASGLPDLPENHKIIRYDLSAEGKGTKLIITFSEENEVGDGVNNFR